MDTIEEDDRVITGNSVVDSKKGWFVGDFFDHEKDGLRATGDVEIKWGIHPKGDERLDWVTGETRTTVSILVSGKFKEIFRKKEVVMLKPGDFCMWGRGSDHRWVALEDSVVITVRWPSIKIF